MTIENIKQLLTEYEYQKNNIRDTLQFLLIMCNKIVEEMNK